MLKNYFVVAFRTLMKYKGYTTINGIGLALGLIAGTFILLYVTDELSYDQFHEKKSRLYRINTMFGSKGEQSGGNDTNGWPIGKILEKEYPEVESVLYARSASFLMLNHEGKRFRQKSYFASPEFFHLFSFPLVKGNAKSALNEPHTIVISESMEQKFFGDADALNKTLVFADTLNFRVTGVMKDIPTNSHIQADMIISFATYERLEPGFSYTEGWGNINMRNYLLLKEGADFNSFAEKSKSIYVDRVGDMLKQWGVDAYVSYEPIDKIYLYSKIGNGMGPISSIDRVYLLSAIAFFVIVLACINFINLTTARSVYRAKEVGLRKVVGSTRVSLMWQYLSESAVVTAFALVISIALMGIFLPFFNQLLEKKYALDLLLQPKIIVGIVGLFMLITFLSGYYPAWVLSALKPVDVLKGKIQTNARGTQLRRGLVVFQFIISTGLVTGTIIVLQQLNFMQSQSLGFNKDQILVLNMARINAGNENGFEAFKNDLQQIAGVHDVSFSNAIPGTVGWQGQVAYPEGKAGDESVSVEYVSVDERYLDVLGLHLMAGRNFDLNRQAELKSGLILNEAAINVFGWSTPEDAIGKKIESPSGTPAGEVIGVVKNYHQEGLQQKIGPITLAYAPQYSFLFAVNYQASETQSLLEQIQSLWSKHFPSYDFNYYFLSESFGKQYQAEQKVARVFGLFASITIIIASIGLLGLVSFMITVRTKEIGIRKLLGASIWNIVRLLNTELVILVIIAVFISGPFIWYYGNQWLQQFAYRMEISPMVFVLTLAIAVLLTILMVSAQSIRAALSNPVDSLRTE